MRYRKGDIVEVIWSDPAGTINEPMGDSHLAQCTTRGTVLRRKGKELVLWHSIYADQTCGDTTILNTGCIDSGRVLLRREDVSTAGTAGS